MPVVPVENIIKKFIAIQLFVVLAVYSFAQTDGVQLDYSVTPPARNTSAIMELNSTGQGFLVPRIANVTNITNPATGLLAYQTSGATGFYYYNGTAWILIGAGSGGTGYIQNQNSGAQTTSVFWISGDGRSSTSFTSPLVKFTGSSNGTVTMQPQASAGTYNFNLPVSAGNSGEVLTSGGGGASPMTWSTPASPAGAVSAYAGSAAPTGWLLCDGTAVSRSTYAALFAVIGTTYGAGNGSTTFNLPNLQNRNIIGKGSGTFATLNNTGGTETHTLTTAQLPAHTHTYTDVFPRDDCGNVNSDPYGSASGCGDSDIRVESGDSHGQIQRALNTGSTGSGSAHNILDPYLVLNYIIKW